MSIAAHAALIGFQFLVCLLSAAGWGYWLYAATGGWCARPAAAGAGSGGPADQTAPLLCIVAGGCLGWIVLQDAVYFGLRLQWSAPIAAIVALAGVGGWLKTDWGGRALRPALALAAAVFAFQGAGAISVGPADYYGYARQDQVNYVQLAQFLVEQPYSTSGADVGLQPWLAKGVQSKSDRIGQSVALGYLAAATGSDASKSYGTISIFFVALTAVAVAGCLLAYGVAPRWAWLGGAWSGVLPGITQAHLDGFFSQSSTIFCFVGLAWALRLAGERPRLATATAALFLGFLLSAYSEEYLLGLALALGLVAAAGLSGAAKRALGAWLIVLPWAALAPFGVSLATFIHDQYLIARHIESLGVWQPRSGTWRGWNELFLAAPSHRPLLLAAAALLGAGLLLLAIFGALPGTPSGRVERVVPNAPAHPRAQLLILALFCASVLAVLVCISQPAFPAYAFGKLTVTFSPLFLILILCAFARPSLRWLRAESWLVPGLIILAAWSSWTKLAVVWHNGGGLPTVNTPAARSIYRELEAHAERTYLITEPHGMLSAWFAYHARHARVYSTVGIGDGQMDPHYEFLRPPPAGQEVWEVSHAGVAPLRR